jgi:hypothetical protein
VTARRERAEERAKRQEMGRRFPSCRWCRKPVTCGQIDGEGVPAHYGCQIPFLQLSKPHRHASTVNPSLPQVQRQASPEQKETRYGRLQP